MGLIKKITAFAILGLSGIAAGNAMANDNVQQQLNTVKVGVQQFAASSSNGVDFTNPQMELKAKTIFKSIGKGFGTVGKTVASGFSEVVDHTKDGLKTVGIDVNEVGESISSGVGQAKTGLKSAGIDVDQVAKTVSSGVKTVGKGMATGAGQVKDGLKTAGVDVDAVGKTVLSSAGTAAQTVGDVDLNQVGQTVYSGASAGFEATKDVLKTAGEGVNQSAETFAENVASLFKNIKEKVTPSSVDNSLDSQGYEDLIAKLSSDKVEPSFDVDSQGYEDLIAQLSSDRVEPVFTASSEPLKNIGGEASFDSNVDVEVVTTSDVVQEYDIPAFGDSDNIEVKPIVNDDLVRLNDNVSYDSEFDYEPPITNIVSRYDEPEPESEIRTIGGDDLSEVYFDEDGLINAIGADPEVVNIAEDNLSEVYFDEDGLISAIGDDPQMSFDFDGLDNSLDVVETSDLVRLNTENVSHDSEFDYEPPITNIVSQYDEPEPEIRTIGGDEPNDLLTSIGDEPDWEDEPSVAQFYEQKNAQELEDLKAKYPNLKHHYTQGNMDRVVFDLKTLDAISAPEKLLENRVKFQQVLEFASQIGEPGEEMLKTSFERVSKMNGFVYTPFEYHQMKAQASKEISDLGYDPHTLTPLDDKKASEKAYKEVVEIANNVDKAYPGSNLHDVEIEPGRVCNRNEGNPNFFKRASAVALGVGAIAASGGTSVLLSLGAMIANKNKCDQLDGWEATQRVATGMFVPDPIAKAALEVVELASAVKELPTETNLKNKSNEIVKLNQELYANVKSNIEGKSPLKTAKVSGEYISDNEFVVKNIPVVETSTLVINKNFVKDTHRELTEQNNVLKEKKLSL